jgi:hypothetical protein
MRAISLLLVLICLTPLSTKAQKFEFNGEFLLFREAKTKQPVLIINDSLAYKGTTMKRIAFKHTEYPAKLQEYKFFNIGTKTYLVHEGCGPVLEYRNDSIVRIDNSFLHRNQFGAVRFVYNKEIYFYGGYGLFTFKNILTKFDFTTGEWIEVNTKSDFNLETRAYAYSYIKNNELYIFGGVTKDENKAPGGKPTDNTIYKLNLLTMKWNIEGSINGISNIDYFGLRFFSNSKNKLYIMSDFFYEIDPIKNVITKSNLNFFKGFLSNYIEGDQIVCILQNEINKTKYFKVESIDITKGNQLSTIQFISTSLINHINIYIFLFIFLMCVFCILIFRKKISNTWVSFNGIVYKQKENQFYFKGKVIDTFEPQEKKLLIYLLEKNNEYQSLNNLNQIFENKGQQETISATVKRREQTVSRLLIKISKITGFDEKKLVLEQKNTEDKRIKDVLLFPNLLKKEY